MFSSLTRVKLGSANTMILVELRGRLWLINNRIVGGADGLCAGLDRQLGGYLGLGSGHTPGYWGITTLQIARGGLSFSLIAIAGSQVAIG